MSHRNTNEVHIYVGNTEQKNTVRNVVGAQNLQGELTNYEHARIYSITWNPFLRIYPNSPSMQHLKPMVNLKELQEIVLLISLGIPAEEAISTITKQGYDS